MDFTGITSRRDWAESMEEKVSPLSCNPTKRGCFRFSQTMVLSASSGFKIKGLELLPSAWDANPCKSYQVRQQPASTFAVDWIDLVHANASIFANNIDDNCTTQ